MSDIEFADHLLLRMPAESYGNYFKDFQYHLDNLHFRTAVYLASPVFYDHLEQASFISEKLSNKEKHTLQKYINRFCFRPTPFGLFSSVSLIAWGGQTLLHPGHISPSDWIASPDQSYVLRMGSALLENELADHGKYESNPTLYRLLEDFRFVSTATGEHDYLRKYLLQSTDYSRVLEALLGFCSLSQTRVDIVKEIIRLASCTMAVAEDYFNFLADEQILIPRLRPSITGAPYLEILLSEIGLQGNRTNRTKKLNWLLRQLKKPEGIPFNYFKTISDHLNILLPSAESGQRNQALSVIFNRKTPSAILDDAWQEKIRNGLFALTILCPDDRIGSMDLFVKVFQKDFEGQSLPLLYALDPEVGIGYFVTVPDKENHLLETVNITAKRTDDHAIQWTPAHSFLLDQWHKVAGSGAFPVVRLQESDLLALKGSAEDIAILGISVLFRISGQQLFLESSGGINAPALMGRFTVGDEEITSAVRKMAALQEAANPDLLFAEILHLAGPHTDNVNRRESIWSWEIPVTASSTLKDERKLMLSDLRIYIDNGKVILYSELHQKIVVPRMTLAYNHSIDRLPLFRFLADLSYQYGRYNFSLDLRQMFPGLSFYPRVEYKQTILHLAVWVLSEQQLKSLDQKEAKEIHAAFGALIIQLGLPPVFTLTEGDQQLVFFRDREADVLFFAACVKQKAEVSLKEFLYEPAGQAFVKDKYGASFISQFNACLLPEKPVAMPVIKRFLPVTATVKRKFIPGSEWLYLKIYTSRIGTKRLLLKILPLIRRKYPHGPIKKWFFIRYEDHAPHIRLRMQIVPQDIADILTAFKDKLENGVSQHVIREYHIDVYSRELERYEAAGIEASEDFFWSSSELVIRFLKIKDTGKELFNFQLALLTMQEMTLKFIPGTEQQLHFVAASFQQFFPEFEQRPLKVEMDKKYRELSTVIAGLFKAKNFYRSAGLLKVHGLFSNSLDSLHESLHSNEPDHEGFLRSMIHMHLNRIFTDESRKQEMVCYYLLYKYLISVKGRNKRTDETN